MKGRTARTIAGVTALWVSVGVGGALAQTAPILPIDPNTLRAVGSAVNVTILSDSGADITDTWLPQPGVPVQIVVNGLASFAIELVLPPAADQIVFNGTVNPFLTPGNLTTSAYPDRCTNCTSGVGLAPDFAFDRATGWLTPLDWGGMAVFRVTDLNNAGGPYFFIVPRDGTSTTPANGIPDSWEATFCPASHPCPTGREDGDSGPLVDSRVGDGIAAFDEYRGFEIAGVHRRFDPRKKELIIGVRTAQCGGQSYLAAVAGSTQKTYPTTGESLFANLANLLPGTQIHVLGFSSGPLAGWVDNLASYSVGASFQFTTPAGAVSDRQINANAVFPITGTATGSTIQKGIRFTECSELTPAAVSPVGFSGVGSPAQAGNPVLFTQRMIDAFIRPTFPLGLIPKGEGRPLKYSTFVNGDWTTPSLIGDATSVAAQDFLISKYFLFVTAHEGGGHSTELVIPPTVYQNHYATGSGDQLDLDATCTNDRKSADRGGFNTCYIPSFYGGADLRSFKLKD